MPNLVPREHLTNALSLSNINFQLGTIVGPALAGLLLALFHSASVVYWFDALSYFAVLAALLLIRTRLPAMSARQVNFGAALDGLRFVRRSPIMASTMMPRLLRHVPRRFAPAPAHLRRQGAARRARTAWACSSRPRPSAP